MTEEQALRQIKRGSQDALVWFIDRYGSYVSAVIRGIFGTALTECQPSHASYGRGGTKTS